MKLRRVLLIMFPCFPMSGRVHSVELGPDGDQQQLSATYPENIQFLDTQVGSSPIAQRSNPNEYNSATNTSRKCGWCPTRHCGYSQT